MPPLLWLRNRGTERPNHLPKVIRLLPARCQPVTREGLCVPTLQLQAVEGPMFPILTFVLTQTLSAHLLWVPCAGKGQSGRCCCAVEPCGCCATGPGLERGRGAWWADSRRAFPMEGKV